MTDSDFTELAARCEALSRFTLSLTTQLEEIGLIDGHRFQEDLLDCLPYGSPLLDRSAVILRELVTCYAQARANRRAKALWSENRRHRDENPT